MIATDETVTPKTLEWQQMRKKFHQSTTLAALVLVAWQMGMWLARAFVEYELNQRAQQVEPWGNCSECGARLHSKGYASRRMLALVGWVEWRRRIGRCPNRCGGPQVVPLDVELEIVPYQQTSTELMRLGCLLSVFLPFGLAAHLLEQLSGIAISDAALWQWVQQFGSQQMADVQAQVQEWQQGHQPLVEEMSEAVAALAAADQQNFRLEQDVALWNFLSYLIQHYASKNPFVHPLKSAHAAVMLTREYLHAHYTNDISLESLAAIAGLSRFHFCRVFRQTLGVSPNVYQTQLRITQAKKLLIQGMPVSAIAEMTGFYDQSHFGWQFKRQVGVTPRRYQQNSNNFLD